MTTKEREPTPDEAAGIAWWNALTKRQRAFWLEQAASASPADARRTYQELRSVMIIGPRPRPQQRGDE